MEERQNTDESFQLIHFCSPVSNVSLKLVKNLVHYVASHSGIYVFVYRYSIYICRNGTLITSHHIVLVFVFFVKTLIVVNHYLSLCDTCVPMLKPTHGKQRDFVTDEMQQGSSSVMLPRRLGACCIFFSSGERKGKTCKEKKGDTLIWAFQSKHTTFINAATRMLQLK